MTADVELLRERLYDYADGLGATAAMQASDVSELVALLREAGQATAAQAAEIEALRTEVDRWRSNYNAAIELKGRAFAESDRLAEALRHQRWCRTCGEGGWDSCEEGRAAVDLLRDHDQEDEK